MQKPKLLVIVCETAGKQGSAAESIQSFLNEYGSAYHLVTIQSPPQLAPSLKGVKVQDYAAAAVYGGDGTIAAALKVLSGRQLPVLILPGGTANVLAKYYGMPATAQTCLTLYLNNTLVNQRIDVATINGEPLVLDMHMGLWTQAITETPRKLKQQIGQSAYAWSALKKAPGAQPQLYKFAINDKPPVTIRGYTFLIVNQGNHNILGIPLFPHHSAPGLLQIAIVKSVQPSHLIAWFICRLFGKNLKSVIEVHHAKHLTFLEAPRRTLLDDTSRKLSLPAVVVAREYSASILAFPTPPDTSRFKKVFRNLRLRMYRTIERIRILSHIAPNKRFSLVAPNLYVGGRYPARAHQLFQAWGVTGIVSMRSHASKDIAGFELLSLPTKDHHAPSILSLRQGVDFIRRHISNGGNVYVHCNLGEGRGPTMAAAYLIAEGYDIDEAINVLKKYRPSAHPNKVQRKRLAEWQEWYNGSHKGTT